MFNKGSNTVLELASSVLNEEKAYFSSPEEPQSRASSRPSSKPSGNPGVGAWSMKLPGLMNPVIRWLLIHEWVCLLHSPFCCNICLFCSKACHCSLCLWIAVTQISYYTLRQDVGQGQCMIFFIQWRQIKDNTIIINWEVLKIKCHRLTWYVCKIRWHKSKDFMAWYCQWHVLIWGVVSILIETHMLADLHV